MFQEIRMTYNKIRASGVTLVYLLSLFCVAMFNFNYLQHSLCDYKYNFILLGHIISRLPSNHLRFSRPRHHFILKV